MMPVSVENCLILRAHNVMNPSVLFSLDLAQSLPTFSLLFDVFYYIFAKCVPFIYHSRCPDMQPYICLSSFLVLVLLQGQLIVDCTERLWIKNFSNCIFFKCTIVIINVWSMQKIQGKIPNNLIPYS